MRRHAGGTGCGARGRERTLLPHPGGAGSSARRPLRAWPPGPDRPPCASPKMRRPAGTTDGTRKARPGAVRKTPAMARHEAPASLERERGTERTMVAPPGAPSPSPLRGTERDDGVPGAEKNTGDDTRPCCLTIEYTVIPGRAESANPDSRNTDRACIWIPGPALARRPGMTSEVDVSQIRTSWPGSSRLRAEASIKWLSCPRPSAGEGPAMTSFLLACPGDVDARDKRGHDGAISESRNTHHAMPCGLDLMRPAD